jgi:uncharacterized protein YkwD
MGPRRSNEWDLRVAKMRRTADVLLVRNADSRFVRRLVLPFAALALLLAAAAPALAVRQHHTGSRSRLDSLSAAVLVDVNQVRRTHGLRPLRLSLRLTAAAAQHSQEMAQRGYFEHSSANGTAFWKRIIRFYPSRGYRSWAVGENLLWSSPDVDAAGALHMWMTSPEHRANLLAGKWREIGLAAVHVPSAPGVYDGDEVTILTADFGVRR